MSNRPPLTLRDFGQRALEISSRPELSLFYCLFVLRGRGDSSKAIFDAVDSFIAFRGPVTRQSFLQWLDHHPRADSPASEMVEDCAVVLDRIRQAVNGELL